MVTIETRFERGDRVMVLATGREAVVLAVSKRDCLDDLTMVEYLNGRREYVGASGLLLSMPVSCDRSRSSL